MFPWLNVTCLRSVHYLKISLLMLDVANKITTYVNKGQDLNIFGSDCFFDGSMLFSLIWSIFNKCWNCESGKWK